MAPQLCHPSARTSNSSAVVVDGASLVTSWLGAASGPPLGSVLAGGEGGLVLAAPPHGTQPCSSVLGEACWAASASPGGRRHPSPSPGHQEGTQRGTGGRGRELPPSHQPPGPSYGCGPHIWGWSGQGGGDVSEQPPAVGRTGHPTTRLLEGWLPAGAILERLETSPGGLVLVAAGSAKYGLRGRPPCPAAKAAPRQGSVQLPYLRGRAAGPEGPGVPRGRRAAEQVGAADVMAGQLVAGRARPATVLEERVGKAGSGRAGGPPVGHRNDGGGSPRHPLSSACAAMAQPHCGRAEEAGGITLSGKAWSPCL